MSKNFSRWELAKIKAILESNIDLVQEDQDIIDAKLEIEKEVEGNNSNVLVEALNNRPSLWIKIRAWLTV